jgi:hypothetical protein
MRNLVLIPLIALVLSACETNPEKPSAGFDQDSALGLITVAEKQATPQGRDILQTGRRMALIDQEILPGSCWDYIDNLYDRAGYPANKRATVFKGSKHRGPYASPELVQPGDWLYYINHQYGGVEHSAVFVDWQDRKARKALMLSYGGEGRRAPGRYLAYDLSNVYTIIRPQDL